MSLEVSESVRVVHSDII